MFGSKNKTKTKKKTKGSGFDPPMKDKPTQQPDNGVYQTISESSVGYTDRGSVTGSNVSHVTSGLSVNMNASDDIKIDSLRTKSPERHVAHGRDDVSARHQMMSATRTAYPPAPAPPPAPPISLSPPPPPAPPLMATKTPPPAPPIPPPAPPPPPPMSAPPISRAPPSPVAPPIPAKQPTRNLSRPGSASPPPVPEHTMSTVDRNRNYAVFSTIPRDNEVENHTKKSDNKKKSSSSFDNPIFMQENGPVPQAVTMPRLLKGQQNHFPGFGKKVSWDEAVVYSGGAKTDIVISGIPEEDSETDEPSTPKPKRKDQSFDYSGSSLKTVPETKGVFETIAPVLASDDEGSELQVRHKRLFTDRQDIGVGNRPPPIHQRAPQKKHGGDNKCSLCVAVVMLAFAIVGLAVLGTLYGVRYASELTVPEQITQLKETYFLVKTKPTDVFVRCHHRPPNVKAHDEVSYFLLEKESYMPWQSPNVAATLTWLKGSSVKVYMIDRGGRLSTRILGEPVTVPGSQNSLTLQNVNWYAATVANTSNFAFISLVDEGTWVNANMTTLLANLGNKDPQLRDEVKQFARPG